MLKNIFLKSGKVIFLGAGHGTGQGFSYLRCVKGDSKSIEDKIWKLGATF